MSLLAEFKEFALKGNVVDMAVGVVIGGAFGKIVTSLVSDVIMPVVGVIVGGVNFNQLKLTLKAASVGADGKVIEAVTLNYGNLIQVAFDFLIVTACIFAVIKAMNVFRRPQVATPEAPVEATPPEQQLLTEIRDLLKTR